MSDKTFRIEKDSMGELEVPEDALWGAQTQRAVNNFPISGLPMPRQFIAALGLVKWAAAGANAELGLLKSDLAVVIQQASLSVAAGEHDEQFPIDVFQTGSGTSSNMNANEVISHLATAALGSEVHPNDHVNMSQSSNDVIPTCVHVSAAISYPLNGCHARYARARARWLAIAGGSRRGAIARYDEAPCATGPGRHRCWYGNQRSPSIWREGRTIAQ
jgi:fumarate hydratase class II